MDAIISAVSTVGFPIFSFLISSYFIKYTYDVQIKRESEYDKMMNKQWEQLQNLTQAVNENSQAIREMVGVLNAH